MDMESGTVLLKNKSRTTHENLVIGIENAVSGFDRSVLSCVRLVSLSSTLATNSVVEGRSGRVALVSAGKVYEGEASPDYVINVPGGHNIHGGEENSLDKESVIRFVESVRGKVDAFAISSVMSVRNPEHELIIKDIVDRMLGIPAVCGHELSSTLGYNVRTATCVMNAGLIPVMNDLMKAVRRMMADMELDVPLMVVKGDGSLMSENAAVRYPVETVMSGPTASMVGSVMLTGLKDAVVVDVGGTTTDIGVLRGGLPAVVKEGISVGGKRTHVMAARITTAGFGGDSRVYCNGSRVKISSVRAVPLCVAAEQWPEVLEHLRGIPKTRVERPRQSKMDSMEVLDDELFVSVREPDGRIHLTENEKRFLSMTRDQPQSRAKTASSLGCSPRDIDVDSMEKYGYLRRISVTPTDVVSVMGLYDEMCTEASSLGVAYLAGHSGRTVSEFIEQVRTEILRRTGHELINAILTEEFGETEMDRAVHRLADRSLGLGRNFVLDCSIRPRLPIVGIGASAGIYVRWLGEALGTRTIVPSDSDVGNAVGAISAPMSATVSALIIPTSLGISKNGYEVYIRSAKTECRNLEEAKTFAVAESERIVRETLIEDGATDIKVETESEDVYIEVPEGSVLSEVRVSIRGIGKPAPFASRARFLEE